MAGDAHVAIVADDLTGALDAGLQLAKRGMQTRLALHGSGASGAQALVIDTESREAPLPVALERVARAAQRCAGRSVYKKVDSTLRGHVGPEVALLRDALGLRTALIAPSFAGAERRVVKGHLLVDGVPLHHTSLAHDPLWPSDTDEVCALVGRGLQETPHCLTLAQVRSIEQALPPADIPPGIYIADAEDDADLGIIARWLVAHAQEVLPCGSAGLAAAWAEALALSGDGPRAWPGGLDATLIVAGSRNAATLEQIETLQRELAPVDVALDPADPERELSILGEVAGRALAVGRDVLLRVATARVVAGAASRISAALADIARHALDKAACLDERRVGLALTGGDTAIHVCAACGIAELEIVAEIEPGIPGSLIVRGALDGLPMVTKAGGFGSPAALVAACHWLRTGRTREERL